MDLGAMVCRPRPRCEACPVAAWCADPTVYVAPPRQTAFAGSDRQVRGEVVRMLARTGSATAAEITVATGLPTLQVESAATALAAEGLIEVVRGRIRLSRIG